MKSVRRVNIKYMKSYMSIAVFLTECIGIFDLVGYILGAAAAMDKDEKMITCPICRGLICPTTLAPVAVNPCGHVLHKQCAESHLTLQNECPSCRTPCGDKQITELKFPYAVQTPSGFCPMDEYRKILTRLGHLQADLKAAYFAFNDSSNRYANFFSTMSDHLKDFNHRVYTPFEDLQPPFESPASIIKADKDNVFRPCCTCKELIFDDGENLSMCLSCGSVAHTACFAEWNSCLYCMSLGGRIKLYFTAEATMGELENEVAPLLDFQRAHAEELALIKEIKDKRRAITRMEEDLLDLVSRLKLYLF